MPSSVQELVDELFGAFQAGDLDRAGRCFAPQGRIAQRFGPKASEEGRTWAEARRDLEKLMKFTGNPKYHDRRISCWPTGFVEQHVSELKPLGSKKSAMLPAVLVGRIDPESGLITLMEEYLDPSPIMPVGGKEVKPLALAKPAEETAASKAQNLAGAVAVISGASSGIGEAIAVEHARRGGRLVLTARRADELQRVAELCRAAGAPAVRTVAGDGRERAVAEAAATAARELGGVDRLYLNAGVSQNTEFLDGEGEASVVREMMEVNFFAAVDLTRACLPSLLERRGRICAISSVQGRCPAPRNTGYSASKHAMHGFFESLRAEISPKGVTVTMVLPGPVATPILSNLKGPGGKTVALQLDEASMKGMTTADEAGRIIVDTVEAGSREVAFPRQMVRLLALRASNPEQADALVSTMYTAMETREVHSSKL